MVSTDSLLDAHEVAVRARVEELRQEAERVAAALGEAELALEHVAITKATLAVVLAGGTQRRMPAGARAASERVRCPSGPPGSMSGRCRRGTGSCGRWW